MTPIFRPRATDGRIVGASADGAREMWPTFHAELAAWCRIFDAKLYIDDTARIEEL